MSTRTIEHPLRTITLQYDDTRQESSYEKELLAAYIALHDRALPLQKQKEKLAYEFGGLDDRVSAAEKALAPVAKTLSDMFDEATVLTEKLKDHEGLLLFQARMSDYHKEVISPFHQSIVVPLEDTCDALHNEFEALDEKIEKLMEEFDNYEENVVNELYKNYDKYSLDLNTYDDNEQGYRSVLDGLQFFFKEHAKVIDHYNSFHAKMNEAYAHWDNIKKMLSSYYDTGGLFDNSLSRDVADGKIPKDKSPLYLITPGDKAIAKFPLDYGLLASDKEHTLCINVPMEAVKKGDVFYLQDLVMKLQHYPKMIEKWIFAVELIFENADGIDMVEDDWKGYDIPIRWFSKLNTMPCAVFFIQDRDARHYMIMGDLVLDKKPEVVEDGAAIILDAELTQEVQNRLFNVCLFFLFFCHNTGFSPEPYIEALMAEFEAQFTYQQLKEEYESQIAVGVELKVQPMKEGKPLNNPPET